MKMVRIGLFVYSYFPIYVAIFFKYRENISFSKWGGGGDIVFDVKYMFVFVVLYGLFKLCYF